MLNKLCYITPLLASVAAAVIATAPTAAPAAVDSTQSICMPLGGSKTQCQTPGNVQINDSPLPCARRLPGIGTGETQ
jgi:hypothetical protein